MEGQGHAFVLDDCHPFAVGRPMLVCGTTVATLQHPRFTRFFDIADD